MNVPGNGDSLKLYEVLDRLRDDWREDLEKHERSVTKSIDNLSRDFQVFTETHARQHENESGFRSGKDQEFQAFIDATRITRATHQGAIGVIMILVQILTKNWHWFIAMVIFIITAIFGARIQFGM
jgi:hypothetical protein